MGTGVSSESELGEFSFWAESEDRSFFRTDLCLEELETMLEEEGGGEDGEEEEGEG